MQAANLRFSVLSKEMWTGGGPRDQTANSLISGQPAQTAEPQLHQSNH